MKFLFCNIAYMYFYKGITNSDRPIGGGSWVEENGYGGEIFNFKSEELDMNGKPGKYCLGFVETKSNNGKTNQLHIEKIRGCELLGNDDEADDVTVVFCAVHPAHGFTTVVGWYRHASVFRNYKEWMFKDLDGNDMPQYYNILAKAKDCVLLPTSVRSKKADWEAPRRKSGRSYGFGRANVWFAEDRDNNELEIYLKKLERNILDYKGENWLERFPEDYR